MGFRLLVAGWQGQIARAIVEKAPAHPDVAACAIGRPALDICETRSIERALSEARADIVINAAGYTAVDRAETEADRCFALNLDGARLLAEAAERRGVPIIHLSTDYVFDGCKASPYVETDATTPRTVYGRSKLAGEEAVRAANPRHVILRTAWVHSPFGKNFVKTVLRRAGDGEPLRIVADQRGSPTYAPHLVDVIFAVALQAAGRDIAWDRWGAYHAAGAGSASWRDLAAEALARSGGPRDLAGLVEPIAAADYPSAAARPANSSLDCQKLARTFGVTLPDWREGVAACVERIGKSEEREPRP